MSPFLFLRKDTKTVALLSVAAFVAILAFGSLQRRHDPDSAERREYQYRVDLNGASAFELLTLPGIGEKLAAALIEHRETKGAFREHQDIRKVRGIGIKKHEAIQPFLLEISTPNRFDNVERNETQKEAQSAKN